MYAYYLYYKRTLKEKNIIIKIIFQKNILYIKIYCSYIKLMESEHATFHITYFIYLFLGGIEYIMIELKNYNF